MDISSILNMGFNMPDVNAFADNTAASEISFGDILGTAVNAEQEVTDVQTEEILSEEDVIETDKTFAELVSELKEDISKADSNVIDAAVKMMLSVGNAAEKLMNGSVSEDNDSEDGDVITILTNMVSIVISDAEQDFVSDDETGLALVLSDISAVLKKGLEDGKTADELADTIKELAEDDEDFAVLADAVVSVMQTVNSFENTDEELNEDSTEELSFESAAKTASVTEVLSGNAEPTEKAQSIMSILGNKKDFKDIKSFEDFGKALKIASYSEENNAENDVTFSVIHKTATFARINDVSAQIKGITRSEEPDVQNVLVENRQSAPVFEVSDVEIPQDTETVYKELADFAVEQITESVSAPLNGEVKELVVVLKPESLGEVAVKLTADASGAVSVVLAASNEEVGRAVAQNSSALAESFAKQGINVEDIKVIEPSDAASNMGLDFSNQGFNRRNDEASQSGQTVSKVGSVASRANSVQDAEEVQASAARKLLKEAKLWLTA